MLDDERGIVFGVVVKGSTERVGDDRHKGSGDEEHDPSSLQAHHHMITRV